MPVPLLSYTEIEPISKKPLVNSWELFQKVIADEGRKTLAYRIRQKSLAHDSQYILDMNESSSPTISLSVLSPVFRCAVVNALQASED